MKTDFRCLMTLLTLSAMLIACSDAPGEPDTANTADSAIRVDLAEQPASQAAQRSQDASEAASTLETEILLGSAVKRLCSSVLVSGRTQQHVMENELNNPALAQVTFTFDNDLVTAIGGDQSVSALYRDQIGCTLLKNTSADVLRAQFNPDLFPARPVLPDAEWPLGNQVTLPDSIPGVDLQAINQAVDLAFEDMEPDQNIDTRAVLVIHKGRIIAEKYAEPFHADMPQLGWSMTKTVTAALTGILAGDGLAHIDMPANVAEWRANGDERRAITLEQLLRMSSGLQYSEVYTAGSMSDVILMLYTTGDTAGFSIDKPLEYDPGSTFYYSSGTTNIISRLNRQLFNNFQSYFNFPQERLFGKLGMNSAVMEADASGTFVGSSYMYATPRDWAKIGLLFMQDGVWNGERILPEGWVEYSLTPAGSATRGQYGMQIWLNAGAAGNSQDRPLPNLPTNAYYLSGFEGQNIVMLPDQELIVLRMGVTTRGPRPIWALTEAVMNAVSD
ncbi:serine hydrolase domain-containing protein [Pseudohongiella spirulinae]|uniref:Beta-lactamase class C penicillin binding protein n=1 Tax=Pseudohongiella spirulinae TaxID=1249552 RepID=A0A0S2KGT8_9GAMM|nr:serine hydrolase [Pseudohongiella spirulinae]ALO47552.1 Beta-lactamase class C penicillin binding protein [Pseudohongiella spirulinae]